MWAQLSIVAAAVLFGSTFVIVKGAVADVGPIPFLAVRFTLGGLVLLPFAARAPSAPGELRAGVLCGTSLLVGYVFQTVGLQYTTASVSAFITYMLVVIVPVMSAVALRRPPTGPTIAGVVIATVGLLLLTGGTPFQMGRGELLTLGCAVSFALHIVLLAEYSPRHAISRLTAIQLLFVGLACALPGAALGGYAFTARAAAAAVFTAVAVSALALALQSWGQRQVGPSHTSLLLMVEPVAAAGLAWLLRERLGWRGAAGAALILVGIAVSELRVLQRREAPTD